MFYLAELPDKGKEALSYERFSAGKPYLPDTAPNAELHDTEHFFIGQNFTVRLKRNALLGHAIDASQVAAVCYGKSQIIDGSTVLSQ
jgi:hypothetical protein